MKCSSSLQNLTLLLDLFPSVGGQIPEHLLSLWNVVCLCEFLLSGTFSVLKWSLNIALEGLGYCDPSPQMPPPLCSYGLIRVAQCKFSQLGFYLKSRMKPIAVNSLLFLNKSPILLWGAGRAGSQQPGRAGHMSPAGHCAPWWADVFGREVVTNRVFSDMPIVWIMCPSTRMQPVITAIIHDYH